MKKLILKTAAITLGAVLILLLLIFGILSLCAPSVMAEFSYSMGMNGLSGDYCYQEYQSSNDISYLVRAFETAANNGSDRKADKRFDLLYAHEDFAQYCSERDAENGADKTIPAYNYRSYLCGLGACVKYRLAETEAAKERVCSFAVSETDESFPTGNPAIYLAVEVAKEGDKAVAAILMEQITGATFAHNTDYENIVEILKECINE